MERMTTFLMAGGVGARLHPLTRERSKPSVPFGGKYRLIDFTLSNCLHSGVRRIGVLTQYKSDSLTRHLSVAWNVFRPHLGEYVNILHPQMRESENWYRGTADAVFHNRWALRRDRPAEVMVLSGDHVYAMDYRPFIAHHRESDADLTIATVPVPRSESARYGILRWDPDGRVVSFHEKPDPRDRCFGTEDVVFASMGVYVFKTRVLLDALEAGPARNRWFDFGREIIPRMLPFYRVYAYQFRRGPTGRPGYWRDVGTVDSYFAAHMDLLRPDPPFDPGDPGWPVITEERPLAPARVGLSGGTVIQNSLIAPGCDVRGKVRHSFLSPGVCVGEGAEVENAILLGGASVGEGCRLRRAVLDKGARLAPGASLGYESDPPGLDRTPGGIVVIGKGEEVGADGRIEADGTLSSQPARALAMARLS